jgi:hypothetical protein
MRILLDLAGLDDAPAWAAAADAAGFFGVVVDSALAAVDAPPVVLATTAARVVVTVPLGEENPITFAEELAVLDALSGGRIVGLVSASGLDDAAVREDVALLRAGLSSRPVRHRGARWQVPAGVNDGVPDAVMVTPGTVQVELPLWGAGIPADLGVPVVLDAVPAVPVDSGAQPGRATLTGEQGADLDVVTSWADAGATHLIVAPPTGSPRSVLRDYVARHLIPEAGMVAFPRLLAAPAPPPAWSGPTDGTFA